MVKINPLPQTKSKKNVSETSPKDYNTVDIYQKLKFGRSASYGITKEKNKPKEKNNPKPKLKLPKKGKLK